MDGSVTRIDGRVEALLNGVLSGWAWNPAHPAERVVVAAWVDGVLVAQDTADALVGGLASRGIGDGHYAFSLQLPLALADGGAHELSVHAGATGAPLPHLPSWAGGGVGAWKTTRFSYASEPVNRPLLRDPVEDAFPPVMVEDDPATAAVAGKAGWLFGIDDSDVQLDDGIAEDALNALNAFIDRLDDDARRLRALGFPYVVAVAPSKLATYPELISKERRARVTRRGNVLVRLARERDHIDVLDLLPPLRDAKADGALFLRRDPGWNARGAYFAHRAILKRAALAVAKLSPMSLGDATFARSLAPTRNSLDGLNRFALRNGDLVPCAARPGRADHPDEADAAALRSLRVPAGEHLALPDGPPARVYEREDDSSLPRVLLMGDPCIDELVPWIAEAASRLVVLPTRTAALEQIELESPDVVLHVLDERRLPPVCAALSAVTRSRRRAAGPASDPLADARASLT